MSLLERIHGHDDLLTLTEQEQTCLCDEIRAFLVSAVSKTGGHLASNLGLVELSVALETVYNTNIDRLVFDVGHQSYVHKLLTDRQTGFAALRQLGGMSGFPKPSESDADAFVAGHASSSVSIALGMARARTLAGENYHVVALIGDGAATGGMTYEALNDLAVSGEKLLVILNDNEMSIAPNVGGFAQHLRRLRTKAGYWGFKTRYRHALTKYGITRWVYRMTHWAKNRVKRLLLPTTIFETMGLSYLGPVDGNDLHQMLSVLQLAKEMDGPVLLHVHTQKGKGYAPAEENPSIFHGVGRFDPKTGEIPTAKTDTFSQNFGNTMMELARECPTLCAISAAMPGGTGLLDFAKAYPERTFDVGIAEEHAVSMAGGLAKQGMIPVVALYSTFLQRSFDQILQDVAILKLHVVFAIDRAGLVGEDGETHHGIFDVGYLRMAPGMRILCPASLKEQEDMLRWAVKDCDGPVAVRYPRGGNRWLTDSDWSTGMVKCHREGQNIALITYGVLTENVLKAAEMLENSGISASVIRLLSVAPLPAEELAAALGDCRHAVIVEEACTGSGIKEALAWELEKLLPGCRVDGLDLGHRFVTHGDMKDLYHHYGLDAEGIAKFVQEVHPVEK